MKEHLPETIKTLYERPQPSINTIISESIKSLKDKMKISIRKDLISLEDRCSLRSLFESELLEYYNRRENIRVIGVNEQLEGDERHESAETTISHVLKIVESVEPNSDVLHISYHHTEVAQSLHY